MKTFKAVVFFVGICVVSISMAQGQYRPVYAREDDKNPVERYNSGIHTTGIYNANDLTHCSGQARNRPAFLPDQTPLNISYNRSDYAVNLTRQAINITLPAMRLLNRNGDPMTARHHICLGMYQDASPTGNAYANPYGYTQVDAHFIGYLGDRRFLPQQSSAIYSFYLLHEFGHHLQYWNQDVWVAASQKKMLKNVRHVELAADCLSAALHYLLHMDLSYKIFNEKLKGMLDASAFGGDDQSQMASHHGTRAERPLAARMGVRIASQMNLNGQRPISKDLVDACNTFISKRDQLQGEDHWTQLREDRIPVGKTQNGQIIYY